MGNVGNGTDHYRQIAEKMAGLGRERLVRAIAEYHHGNESLHMHQDIERREPCSYCWLRAGRAMQIVGEHLPVGALADVASERADLWSRMGGMTPPDGTGGPELRHAADTAKQAAFEAFRDDGGSWVFVLAEEASRAFAEPDPAKLRTQLVSVAAHALCWIEAIDRREHPEAAT